MRRLLHALICLVSVSLALVRDITVAGLVPEHVLLVVNASSPSSLTIANEYVHLRNIPPTNIVLLSGVTNVEQLPVDEFRRQILAPVLTAIDQRGLKSQIRCVVYSADLPTAIHVKSDIGSRTLPQVLTPVASINGLTYLYRQTMTRDIRYLDLNANLYARRFGTRTADTPWQIADLKRYAESMQRLRLQSPGSRAANSDVPAADALSPANDPGLQGAIDSLVELKLAHPQSPELLYNLTCALATLEKNAEALATLKQAVAAGWYDHRHASRDPDLTSLRENAEFKSLLADMKGVKLEVQPARGFRSDIGWQQNGEPASQPEPPRYLLSTVLGITAGRGTTIPDVIANLRRSAAADGTRPTGTVYFVRNGDVRSTTREWGFASAVDRLKALGVDAVIEEGILPQKKSQVAGAMIGIADFDWPKCESTIVPGAIVEHLTSFGGVMTTGAGQTPLTEFLRHGAAGASGTVTEPYAIQAKFPNPFIHVHYASGSTLAEAFYLSVTGPYQLLVVGDPLCCPWRSDFRVSATAPVEAPWVGKATVKPRAESPAGLKANEFVMYVDGQRTNASPPDAGIVLDTTNLADGEHQLAVVAAANDSVETMGRWTTTFTVRNHAANQQPILQIAGTGHPFGKPVEIEASCPRAAEITIRHLGRIVARITGESGTARIEPKLLGSGTVALQPVASCTDGKFVHGREVIVQVDPPVQ